MNGGPLFAGNLQKSRMTPSLNTWGNSNVFGERVRWQLIAIFRRVPGRPTPANRMKHVKVHGPIPSTLHGHSPT